MINKKKKTSPILRSGLIFLAVLFGLVVYAYGFKVTKVNLQETKSERRKTQLVRIVRALAQPDLFTYDQTEVEVNQPVMVPCPPSGYTAPEPDKSKPYIFMTPSCADPGAEVTIEGFNFVPNTTGPLSFIPPSDVTLSLDSITIDENGHFSTTVKLPKRDSDQVQYIRAITRQNVGAPHLSQTALDTWDKIIETVFLALLATTFGTLLAIPLSFFAARNLMKDVTTPLISIAFSLIVIPVGILVGARIAGWINQLSLLLSGNIIFLILGTLIGFLIAWQVARLSLPQEEIQKPRLSTQILHILGLVIASLSFIFACFMFAGFLTLSGNYFAGVLGSFGFLGKFFSDVGEITSMLITVLSALAVAGVFSSLTGGVGLKMTKKFNKPVMKTLTILVSAIAGATLFALIMAGIDWLYQINNPIVTLYWPAALGALVGILISLRFDPMAPLPIGIVIYYISRTIFNALRSIEALIMVIVFVVWVGIGPFAGVLALSLHTIAALAKLYSEQVESIMTGPMEAIKATGANGLQTIVYAVIPQIIPPYISFTMYRWDINVRMSTIIGFAGGGGIGFLLYQNINLLNYRAASAQMLAIALVVASMDYLSSRMREKVV